MNNHPNPNANDEQWMEWNQALSSEGARLRAAMELPQADIERMLADSLARIAASGARPARLSASDVLMAMRSLLEPVFGNGTMTAAVNVALRESGTQLDGIAASNWREFVARLSTAIAQVCGLAAGRLVDLAGVSLGNALLTGGDA